MQKLIPYAVRFSVFHKFFFLLLFTFTICLSDGKIKPISHSTIENKIVKLSNVQYIEEVVENDL